MVRFNKYLCCHFRASRVIVGLDPTIYCRKQIPWSSQGMTR